MGTKFHWKIIIAFIVTPILCLTLFVFIYSLVLKDPKSTPTSVFIFLAIFGLLGFWLLLTLIMRAKRIKFKENSISIFRIITLRKLQYNPADIISYSITLRKENPYYDYEILQFKTNDDKIHSIVSYEFNQFDKILNWFDKSKVKKEKIGINSFLINEYGLPFLISVILITGIII
jgi:hypothetical protein